MNNKGIWVIVIILILALAAVVWLWKFNTPPEDTVIPIPQSTINNAAEKKDKIILDMPTADAIITSPLTIKGKAVGPWYFEASFPIEITDRNGNVIVQNHAEATGDWMTTDFVPFERTVTFTAPTSTDKGYLILRKDNPSGLPEHEDYLQIPIKFR